MAFDKPPGDGFRPRQRSPAERGLEFAAHQQQLKEEAAERRRVIAEAGGPAGRGGARVRAAEREARPQNG